jgi:hypothetical protein
MALAFSGCAGTGSTAHSTTRQTGSKSGLTFVPGRASALQLKCRATARALGYPVPCLTAVPKGMSAAAALQFIGYGARSWRHWAVGSTYVGPEHLVTTGSPRRLANYAKVVNGPAWFPNERVQPITWTTINGWRMRAVYVSPNTNDGSAFMSHVVLIWTVGRHTYGVGFHDQHGRAATLRLDEELAKHVALVRP